MMRQQARKKKKMGVGFRHSSGRREAGDGEPAAQGGRPEDAPGDLARRGRLARRGGQPRADPPTKVARPQAPSRGSRAGAACRPSGEKGASRAQFGHGPNNAGNPPPPPYSTRQPMRVHGDPGRGSSDGLETRPDAGASSRGGEQAAHWAASRPPKDADGSGVGRRNVPARGAGEARSVTAS